MDTVHTVVIGAGHAGLVTSRALAAAGVEHVVLERGEVGRSWRDERWDTLTLLTPAWMNALPGDGRHVEDPDAFLTARQFAARLADYAASGPAPVLTGTAVEQVRAVASEGTRRFRVATQVGTWSARNVVVATGPGAHPVVPAALRALPARVSVVPALAYRRPSAVPPGAVLVVGASSSGVQIADELARSGRRVLLAVGRHTRVPRRYRGMDLYWWLQRTGRLDRRRTELADPGAGRHEPSLQLVGREPVHAVDLPALQSRGVELLGRLVGLHATRARFADDLAASAADADRRMRRVLASIDAHIAATGLSDEVLAPDVPAGYRPPPARTEVDLAAERITAVVLATGLRPHLPWLRVPVLGPDGAIREDHGISEVPGLYTVGQRFQSRRSSGLIAGARHDVAIVVDHLTGRLGRSAAMLPAGQCGGVR
jgi:putative flavoprotein involved in K+ transport